MADFFPDDNDRPIAIAHRGGAAAFGSDKYKRENTLEAFSAVWKMGYKYLEMDVISTRDNKVIVLHVAKNGLESIFRKKDAPSSQQLQQMTYGQLKQRLGRDIPSLDQVLKTFPEAKFLIDAKTNEVVEPLAQVIKENKAVDRVCLASFYPHRIVKLRQLLGDRAYLGLIISRSPLHFGRQWNRLKRAGWRDSTSVSIILWPAVLLSKRRVNLLHKWGLRVLAWTPNSRQSITGSVNKGVDGVISDNASLLKELLA
jgi:glycerophosphoryl diester phosphodiesterase